jgi:hypothetical protein
VRSKSPALGGRLLGTESASVRGRLHRVRETFGSRVEVRMDDIFEIHPSGMGSRGSQVALPMNASEPLDGPSARPSPAPTAR